MTAPMAGICCGNCIYYEMNDDRAGECRRHAPQPNTPVFVTKMESVGAFKVDTHWPKVYATNWCGQYNPPKKGAAKQKPPAGPKMVKPRVQKPVDLEEDEDIIKLSPDE